MADKVVHSAWRVLQAVYPTLPRREMLARELHDAEAAQQRGYYLPDEDERLRVVYLRYLSARALLWQMLRELDPRPGEKDLRLFALAFCAASALVRSASFLIEMTRNRPVVHRKLDEAEPRYGLPRKAFTRIYRSFTAPTTAWRYHQGRQFFEANHQQIVEQLRARDLFGLVDYLEAERPHFPPRRRTIWSAMLSYRFYSLTRRAFSSYDQAMFHLFRMSGSAIAGRRQPFLPVNPTGKRVTPGVVESAASFLKPGDILITRHDDALSNLFLPGFWPHAALYLGPPAVRREAGLPDRGPDEAPVLEAKKDGVKLRPLSETLAVDAFLILRPHLDSQDLPGLIERALSHEGKLYDFLFDFRRAERLACTEVIYRSFHGLGPWRLALVRKGGRLTLPAETLIQQVLDQDFAGVAAIFGAENCPFTTGSEAGKILRRTLQH